MPEINSKKMQNKQQQKKVRQERSKEAKKKPGRVAQNLNITWEGSAPEKKEEKESSTKLYLILGGLFLFFLFVLWAFVEDTPTIMAKEKAREKAEARRNATASAGVSRKNVEFESSVLFNSTQLTQVLRQLSDPQEEFDRIVMVAFDDSTRDDALGDVLKVKSFRKMEAVAKAMPRKKVFQRYDEEDLPMIALFDCGNTNDEFAEQICKQLIQGNTPNVLIYRKMNKPRLLPKEYRSDNQIIGYLHGLMQPAVTFLEERNECEDFVTNDRHLNVMMFGTDDTSVFEAVADSLRDFARFGRTKNPSNAEAFFTTIPSILAWRTFGENPVSFAGNLSDAQAIHTFVLNQYLPTFGEFNERTQQQYMKRGLPIVWIAFDAKDEATSAVLTVAEDIAGRYLGMLSFVRLDVNEQPKIAENFELIKKQKKEGDAEDEEPSNEDEQKRLPQVLIMNQLAQLKQAIDVDNIETSINAVVNEYFQKLQASRTDVQSELEGTEDTEDDETEDDDDDDEPQTKGSDDVDLDSQPTKEDL